MSTRALPLLLVAVLTSAGAWHVSAPGLTATGSAEPVALAQLAELGRASECSIAGRGQVCRGAVPGSTSAGGIAAREERRTEPPALGGVGSRAPPIV